MRTYVEFKTSMPWFMQRVSGLLAETAHLIAASRRASIRCKALLGMSDDELASRGLARQDIGRHVLKDVLDA